MGESSSLRAAEPTSTDLLWKGKPVAKEQVARVFWLGSLAVAVLGVLLNWGLTDGTWEANTSQVDRSAVTTGDGAAYLTGHPFDLVTGGILVVSLIVLGAGFLRDMVSQRASNNVARVFILLGFLLYILATTSGVDPLLTWISLAVAAPFLLRTYLQDRGRAHGARAAGFVLFGFYWATQAMRLYTAEGGDFVNMTFALVSVPFFNYFAYHEILSRQTGQNPRALIWLSGTAFITTGVYFLTHKIQAVSEWLILRVSEQTEWMLHLFGQDVVRSGGDPPGSRIAYFGTGTDAVVYPFGYFPVQIILACTAIQSIMIFVGGILALNPPKPGEGVSGRRNFFNRLYHTYTRRRVFAFALTVPLIYVLNLFRNTIIISMSGPKDAAWFSGDGAVTSWICNNITSCSSAEYWDNYAAFWFSHNIIGKGGSLLALVIIAFIVFRILPELYDSIIGLLDLKERRGPLERWYRERFGRGPKGPTPAVDERPAGGPTMKPGDAVADGG